jgi:hypothetical protein
MEISAGRSRPLNPEHAGTAFRQTLASLLGRGLLEENGDLLMPVED